METFVNVIFSIEMQENNQLITINIYLRAYYLCTIEATRKHQLSHLLKRAIFHILSSGNSNYLHKLEKIKTN